MYCLFRYEFDLTLNDQNFLNYRTITRPPTTILQGLFMIFKQTEILVQRFWFLHLTPDSFASRFDGTNAKVRVTFHLTESSVSFIYIIQDLDREKWVVKLLFLRHDWRVLLNWHFRPPSDLKSAEVRIHSTENWKQKDG